MNRFHPYPYPNMRTTFRTFIFTLSISLASAASSPAVPQRLTPERITDLAAPAESDSNRPIRVEVSGFPKITFNPSNSQGVIEVVREFPYPTKFEPPKVLSYSPTSQAVIPATPSAFDKINAGWTIHLQAKRLGGVVTLAGVAEFIAVELVNGGYGALAGPVYNKRGDILASNLLQQPWQQTTTSRFQLSAVPGETYEVILYQGKKAEKHTIKVSLL